ncbi:hypothetical protein [Vulcanisaeta distributa]|uniref:Uncharacterized protein n=1 Tax=Vulcanisaeta distributa (strain DSM 14429 / JCM 11212 / NBRC 100878 / IC-017) TaxID=572478 RepID=E1QSQ5_VULDI|nr:hypothetical protein [Vulcanisaeta distributa]ADN49572.1 hypothetical protein Vdis_0159 [Vulcanisaeta distributa DSM 14429]
MTTLTIKDLYIPIGCFIIILLLIALIVTTQTALALSMHYGDLIFNMVLFLTSPFNLHEFIAVKVNPSVVFYELFLTFMDLLLAMSLIGYRFSEFRNVIFSMFAMFLTIVVANYLAFGIHYVIWREPLTGISGIATDSSIIILIMSIDAMLKTWRREPINTYELALTLASPPFAIVTLYLALISPYWINHVIDIISLTPTLAIMLKILNIKIFKMMR